MTAAHRVEHARAEDLLRSLPDASVDSVVTDPPYGLSNTTPAKVEACLRAWLSGDDYDHGAKGFMGREWDGWVPGPALWREVLRVLKPGGHALVFAGSRTVDLMGLALRLAGFEIRDTMQWLYGSGFPKSLDVSKALDKAAGAQRDVVGRKPDPRWLGTNAAAIAREPGTQNDGSTNLHGLGRVAHDSPAAFITALATDAAREWAGWGTALKPAHEPVIVARKPLVGTVAANVLVHGAGALNIDGCRVGTSKEVPASMLKNRAGRGILGAFGAHDGGAGQDPSVGRWPTNVVLIHPEGCEGDHNGAGCVDGCPVGEVGAQSVVAGVHSAGAAKKAEDWGHSGFGRCAATSWNIGNRLPHRFGDTGTAARFFPSFHYCAKASRSEREAGLDAPDGARANRHPTVKPIDAMRWLCRLVTRPNGLVLDPFTGSGTTGCAAALEGFRFVGCEMDEAHADLARRRIAHWAPEGEPDAPDCDVPQLDLFGAAS